jgi:hypothetical protein
MPGIGLRSLNANALIYRPTHRDDSKAIFAMSSKNILIMHHTEKPDVSDAPIHIAASPHGTPCEVIAVEDGLVVWGGQSKTYMRPATSTPCSVTTMTRIGSLTS